MAESSTVNGHTNGVNGTNGVTNGVNFHAKSVVVPVDEFNQTSFDYLILGGGTAGCAIAGRLTENPDVTVGVIEAGKYRIGDPLVDTPAAFFQMFENPEYDWCMYTTPQVCLRVPVISRSKLKPLSETQQEQGPSYAAWKASRWIKRNQLHDVRSWLFSRLRRLGCPCKRRGMGFKGDE